MNNDIDAKKLQITETVQEVLEHTRTTFTQIETATLQAIEFMIQDVLDSFFSLGLSEQQEEHIKQILDGCLQKTNMSFEKGKEVAELFDEIGKYLDEIVNIKKMH